MTSILTGMAMAPTAGNGMDRGITMKTKPDRRQAKRLGAMVVAGTMLLQTVGPVYAVVSQLPGLYTAPPEPNVMFTLDDSGSMQADAVPDFSLAVSYTGVPDNDSSAFFNGGRGIWYPNMWGSGSSYLNKTFYLSTNAIARYMRSSAGNPLYYDPTVSYLPWPQAANNALRMLPANVAAVKIDTDDPTQSRLNTALNLTTRVGAAGETNGYWPATYYVYKGATKLPFATPNSALNTSTPVVFDKFEIQGTGTATFGRALTRTDCTGAFLPTSGGCTRAEELQNFANWLQYYRNRRLMAKGAIAASFAVQGTNLRVGYAMIGTSPVVQRGVRLFSGANRTDFFTRLYTTPSSDSVTPLRKAMDDVGQHFTTTDVNNPWAQTPGTSIGTEVSCRRSFHIMSTDGFWNSTGASGTRANNNDNFTGSTPAKPDTTTYAFSDSASSPTDPLVGQFTINPFADGNPDTLADIAAYYWRNDLRSTTLGTALANNVVPSARDPAFWQHLTTFTIGLGISGSGAVKRNSDATTTIPTVAATHPLYPYIGRPWLADAASRDWLVANKVKMDWTSPADDNPATGDDLIHAAMNGRGRYFSATNPTELASGVSDALSEVTANPGSLANVVTETPQVSADTEVYQATYTPSQWSGRLYAFSQSASGVVDTTPGTALWEASNKMPAPANRKIYTWNPVTKLGTSFAWGSLTASQQTSLSNDSTLLDYLRGSDVKEAAQGGPFRNRARYTIGAVKGGVLGDIVNGSPIKGPSAGGGFERLPSGVPGQSTYTTYRATGNTALDNMRNTLFAGANDGMLHAFDRSTGVERFAYVPNSVFSVRPPSTPAPAAELKLKMLSDPNYSHRFTVDGPPQIGDAFIGIGAAAADWKTVLLGSTGAGARSVFAMDISNPKDVTDATAPAGAFNQNKLLWEFSEADLTHGADLGHVISYPHIAKMRANADGTGGAWVAIFGNGYDSANGRATLFILNLQTGAVVWKQSVGAAGGNGLSQPNFTVNNKREVTAIYAGDLKGNLWKFDVDNPDSTQWKAAFGSAPNYAPLFTGSTNQPISVMPEITYHPNGGTLLSFGTGKLFDVEDTATTLPSNVNLNTQAIYGIWDKPGETTGFSGNTTLVPRLLTGLTSASDSTLGGSTSQKAGGGAGETVVDWTTHRGWYLNLLAGPSGERVNVNPQQAKSTLLVVANKAEIDPCKSAGSARLFALDPITGSAPGFGVFDATGDTKINSADKGYNVKSFSSAVLSLPALQSKKAFTDQVVTERAGTRGQTGERLGGVENKPLSPTDCAQWLLAGGSDTTIAGFDISLCSAGKPRISWRQLK